ncbi:hypothetical protein C8J35_101466 [Rhizobium sp. PP-F2F-G38]|nr:hypothetical protein C8J37_101467 [Rhizobium sp. PP-WC-1G-195]PYF00649.1 hypothetical protein C8J35_101466 [Rhizobium sp. PP-F2F-G38]
MFRFQCKVCENWHEGMPGFGSDAPLHLYHIPTAERPVRCALTGDTCIIDETAFFVQGNIEIPVHDADEPFIWGVWVSLSQKHFLEFVELLDVSEREGYGPYFGWLSAGFKVYPDTADLKTKVHLRARGQRPSIELEPTEHPLAVEQRTGISVERLAEIYAAYVHS